MNILSDEKNAKFNVTKTHRGAELIGINNGAKNGFSMGISYYHAEEFGHPGIHDDQEGFYVIEGTGEAKIGEKTFKIFPGLSFIAQKGEPHEIRKEKDSIPVKVLWAHGAVK